MNYTRWLAVALCAALSACVTSPPNKSAPPLETKQAPPVTVAPAPTPATTPVVSEAPASAPAGPSAAVATTPQPKDLPSPAKPVVAASPAKSSVPTAAPVVMPKRAAPPPPAPAPVSAPPAFAAGVAGRIEVVAAPGQQMDAGEVVDAVVYFVPNAGAPHPKPAQFQIYTRDKQFDPTSAVVPLGSTISFPNKDEVLHNVFSASPGAEFDLGLYGEGKSAAYTFAKPGVVTVNCNVHPLMQVSVLVVDSPFFTHPSRSGDFQLSGLPAGPGKLVVWHPRAGTQLFPLLSSATGGVTLQIVLSKPRIAPHLNKEHRPYQMAGSTK